METNKSIRMSDAVICEEIQKATYRFLGSQKRSFAKDVVDELSQEVCVRFLGGKTDWGSKSNLQAKAVLECRRIQYVEYKRSTIYLNSSDDVVDSLVSQKITLDYVANERAFSNIGYGVNTNKDKYMDLEKCYEAWEKLHSKFKEVVKFNGLEGSLENVLKLLKYSFVELQSEEFEKLPDDDVKDLWLIYNQLFKAGIINIDCEINSIQDLVSFCIGKPKELRIVSEIKQYLESWGIIFIKKYDVKLLEGRFRILESSLKATISRVFKKRQIECSFVGRGKQKLVDKAIYSGKRTLTSFRGYLLQQGVKFDASYNAMFFRAVNKFYVNDAINKGCSNTKSLETYLNKHNLKLNSQITKLFVTIKKKK